MCQCEQTMGFLWFLDLTFLKVHHKDEKCTENIRLHQTRERGNEHTLQSLGVDKPDAQTPWQPGRHSGFRRSIRVTRVGLERDGNQMRFVKTF